MDIELIKSMVISGKSFSAVARELGINVGVVSTICKRNNIVSKHMSKVEARPLPVAEIYAKYMSGRSLDSLRIEYNAPIARIKRYLIKSYPDIKFRSMDEAKRPIELNNKDMLTNLYKQHSLREIGRKLGVRPHTVCRAAKRLGIDIKIKRYHIDKHDLVELYENEKLTPRLIARIYGFPYGAVLRKIKQYGLTVSKPGGVARGSKYPQLNDANWLSEQYIKNQKGMGQIAKELGCMIITVKYFLIKHGIKTRTKSEYLKLLMNKTHGCRIQYNDMLLDSQLELNFLRNFGNYTSLERNIEFNHSGSHCFIDFRIDGKLYEIKSREGAKIGPDRRRLVKQIMICRKNNVDVNIWRDGKYVDLEINDIDRYYASNFKLFFNNPNECCDWMIDYGFRDIEYTNIELYDALKHLTVKPGQELNANYPSDESLKLIKHFSGHYWRSSHKDYLPITKAWEHGNQSVLRDAINQIWDRKREINIYNLVKFIGKYYRDFSTVSIFKPWVARHIYQRYLPNGGVVVDPCMGWGGRLLGTIDLPIKYIGYDMNKLSVESHHKLAKFIGNTRLKITPEFNEADSSVCDFSDGDLLFTSPPYDDCELYHGIDSTKTKTEPILHNIFSKFKGTIALNLPKRHRDLCIQVANKHGRTQIDELQMKTASFMGREKTYEPILVFK